MISFKWEQICNFYHSDQNALGGHVRCEWLYSTTKKKTLEGGQEISCKNLPVISIVFYSKNQDE